MQSRQTVESSRSVFVTGSPRSGTSALAWAIAQHADMWTGAEAYFPYYLARSGELDRIWDLCSRRDGWIKRNEMSREEFWACLGVGVDQVFLRRSRGRRWVDSSPRSVLVGPELVRLLPNARFIHIVRDGRFVVASLTKMRALELEAKYAGRKRLKWAIRSGLSHWLDFKSACGTWVRHVEAGRELTRSFPDRAIEVRHERLSLDPEAVMVEVQEFLGLELSSRPAEFLRAQRVNTSYGNETFADFNKPKPLSVLPGAPWREWSPVRKRAFRGITRATMAELGYEMSLD